MVENLVVTLVAIPWFTMCGLLFSHNLSVLLGCVLALLLTASRLRADKPI